MISFSIIEVDGSKQAHDPLGSLYTLVFTGRVMFPQGEGSAVIHCQKKEKRLLHEDATFPCRCLWDGEFMGRKQAQDHPGSLHTIISPVE